MLQLSVLRVFEQILSDRDFLAQPQSEELSRFCGNVTRNLFARLLPPQQRPPAQEGLPAMASLGRTVLHSFIACKLVCVTCLAAIEHCFNT